MVAITSTTLETGDFHSVAQNPTVQGHLKPNSKTQVLFSSAHQVPMWTSFCVLSVFAHFFCSFTFDHSIAAAVSAVVTFQQAITTKIWWYRTIAATCITSQLNVVLFEPKGTSPFPCFYCFTMLILPCHSP